MSTYVSASRRYSRRVRPLAHLAARVAEGQPATLYYKLAIAVPSSAGARRFGCRRVRRPKTVEAVGRMTSRMERAQPVVTLEDGTLLLRVDGVIQSVALSGLGEPDFWDAMLPARRPASALILGFGAGTVASLLTQRFGPVPILGVERDPRIADLARSQFGLDTLENVQLLVADAFSFLPACRARFDYVCIDLYIGGNLQHGVLGANFLRAVARVLATDGSAVFNLWSGPYLDDQVRRLQRVLLIRDITEVERNVVVRCGSRPLVTMLPA